VAILLQSQRHLVGAIRRKQPLPWECQFSYLTDRHSAGSSRWAQDGVRRQPAKGLPFEAKLWPLTMPKWRGKENPSAAPPPASTTGESKRTRSTSINCSGKKETGKDCDSKTTSKLPERAKVCGGGWPQFPDTSQIICWLPEKVTILWLASIVTTSACALLAIKLSSKPCASRDTTAHQDLKNLFAFKMIAPVFGW
jgi:hypothetical protein